MTDSFQNGVRRAGRMLAAALCGALCLALLFMALAVLVQALAVLVIALLSAVLFLPHPLKWYARQGGEAAGVFFDALAESFGAGRKKEESGEKTASEETFRPEEGSAASSASSSAAFPEA